MGGGLQWRPLVHVSDVSNAFLAVLKSNKEKINREVFNVGLDNFQIKNLAYLVREELPFPVEIDVAPDDADKRDYNVVFKKAQEKIGFKAEVGVTQGIKEIYLALKSGKVDVGPKTVTVQWYRNILDANELLESISLDGRVL
jgi:nucleoside-diphosphate-sugar epimerase